MNSNILFGSSKRRNHLGHLTVYEMKITEMALLREKLWNKVLSCEHGNEIGPHKRRKIP